MTTQQDHIDELERALDRLTQQEEDLREELASAQLGQLENQVEGLQVQIRLGAMELRDKVEPIVGKVREQIAEARARVAGGSVPASDAITAVREGVEEAWRDVRSALSEARSSLRR